MRRTLKPGCLSTLSSLTSGAGCCVDAVPGARHGGDDPGFGEALAQCGDGDAYGVRERVGVLVPRPFQEFLGADDPTLGGDKDLEYGELLPGQSDVPAVAEDLPAERVQPQARDLPYGRPVVGAPAVAGAPTVTALTATSISGSGIIGVNQASGNMNNQANAVSVATANDSGTKSSFADSQAAADQGNNHNKIYSEKTSSTSTLSSVTTTGITGVNQASGSMNNQANGVSVAVALAMPGEGGIALSEADLGQLSSGNAALLIAGSSTSNLTGVSTSGITGINQASGSMNNQANVVSVTAATSRSTVLPNF